MKRTALFVTLAMLSALVGCKELSLDRPLAPGRGTTRTLGQVNYQQAFASARIVLNQHYSIKEADPATGIIRCRPKDVQAGNERILGGFPARQVTTLQLTRDGEQVIAQVVVELQRQGTDSYTQMGYAQERRNYSMMPGDSTPADVDAATTSAQNETWERQKDLHDVEAELLDELYKRLHGGK